MLFQLRISVFRWVKAIIIIAFVLTPHISEPTKLIEVITPARWLGLARVMVLMPITTIFQYFQKTIDLSPVTDKLYHIMLYRVHFIWAEFELTTSVVLGTDCIGNCKSIYRVITTTPSRWLEWTTSLEYPLQNIASAYHWYYNIYFLQVGDGGQDHSFWGRPEDMHMNRPAFKINAGKPGSDVAGSTAAALAIGSTVFKTKGLFSNLSLFWLLVWFLVLNATFNKISVIYRNGCQFY